MEIKIVDLPKIADPRGNLTVAEQMKRKPIFVLEHAVRGMLPKNRLGDAIFRNLYVYEGPNHNHEAQQPQELKINTHKQYNK